jgi:hypothetical protein
MGMVLFGKCRGCAHLINLINIYIYMEIWCVNLFLVIGFNYILFKSKKVKVNIYILFIYLQ